MSEQSFESNMLELERIVRELEKGEASLDEMMDLYQKGAALADSCSKKIRDAEQKIVGLEKAEDDE